jgi:1,4-dihydroxy-2-naphthoate octaprenyltransferase
VNVKQNGSSSCSTKSSAVYATGPFWQVLKRDFLQWLWYRPFRNLKEGKNAEVKQFRASVWWKAVRYHFVPPSIFPAVLGTMVAWEKDHTFYLFYFLFVLIGVIINHVALNMADDYFDYKHAVDRSKPEDKNPYTGGSGTLSAGSIKPSAMLRAFCLCFLVTIAIGLFLTSVRGVPVLLFGVLGVFCSVFYTAPPISFSHYGLGEIGLLVNFGTTIGLGSYFVQTQRIGIEAFVATLPLGIMLFSMIVINEIPDYQNDRLAGKLTLVARYGKRKGVKLYVASWACTYAVITLASLSGTMPLLSLVGLVSVPLSFRSIQTLRKHFENPVALAPANLDMIRAHSLTSLGLIIAYSITGILNRADVFQLLSILLLLGVAYTPAFFEMRRPK